MLYIAASQDHPENSGALDQIENVDPYIILQYPKHTSTI